MGEDELYHFLPEQLRKLALIFIERCKAPSDPALMIMGQMWGSFANVQAGDIHPGEAMLDGMADTIDALVKTWREAKLELQVG